MKNQNSEMNNSPYKTSNSVDEFINNETEWKDEFIELRRIVLSSGLTEGYKWGKPCYLLSDVNVAIIHGFKEYCAILFVKGSLLKDPYKILVQQTDKVQAGRQIRFKKRSEILEKEETLKVYINNAIEVKKAGLKVEYKTNADYTAPEELQKIFDENKEMKKAFHALTPGRQRAYILFFSSAKQSKTRAARIDKNIPRILQGKGLDD